MMRTTTMMMMLMLMVRPEGFHVRDVRDLQPWSCHMRLNARSRRSAYKLVYMTLWPQGLGKSWGLYIASPIVSSVVFFLWLASGTRVWGLYLGSHNVTNKGSTITQETPSTNRITRRQFLFQGSQSLGFRVTLGPRKAR